MDCRAICDIKHVSVAGEVNTERIKGYNYQQNRRSEDHVKGKHLKVNLWSTKRAFNNTLLGKAY